LIEQLEESIDGGIRDADARDFIDASPSLFLNLWMAASKCIMMRAAGIEDSGFVIAAGANGVDSAIQVAGLPGRWFSSMTPLHRRHQTAPRFD